MTTRHLPATYVTCPACDGHGEHLLGQSWDGLLHTTTCTLCQGVGEVTVASRVAYLDETGVVEGPQTPEQYAAALAWGAETARLWPADGWDSEPPF